VIRKEAWPFYRTISGVRLYWELEEPKEPKGSAAGKGAMDSCSHCGKKRATLKRCTVCKHAWYCGAACQKAGWKLHKKSCLSLEDVFVRVTAASLAEEWRGLLKWEGRMKEMTEDQPDEVSNTILATFSRAHELGLSATGDTDHALSAIELQKRRVALLGKMERFRDQATVMCSLAYYLASAGKIHEAAGYYQGARDVGVAHGFFSAECNACLGLGQLAMREGREEEGVELLRNALAAAPLNEGDDNDFELVGLGGLTSALFQTHAIDEVEPLVPRYREAAKAESQRLGYLGFNELQSLYASARLHEVLCTCTPCWEPPHTARPLHATKADSICYRIQRSVCTCTPCWESLHTVRPLHSTEAWRLVTGSTTPSKDTRNP
jgi:hypothetical protein